MTSEPNWRAAVQATIDRFGRLDIVADIAGIGISGSIEELDVEAFDRRLAVNVRGVALGCKHGIEGIRRSGGAGAIINMSSVMGVFAPADPPTYAASKGAVTLLTKSVALHCAERGYPFRCVSIHPTDVGSAMLDPIVAAAGGGRQAVLARMARPIPIGRVATPQDVANAVLFGASDEASMISGSGIFVDGAQLAGPASAHAG